MDNEFKLKDLYIEKLQNSNIAYDVQANTNDDGEITSWSIFPNYRSEVSSSDSLAIVIHKAYFSIYVNNIVKNVEDKEKMLSIINQLNNWLIVNFNGILTIDSNNSVGISLNSFYDCINLDNNSNLEMLLAGMDTIINSSDFCFKKLMTEYYSAL